MKLITTLAILAGGFIVVPMGVFGIAVIWGVAKINPVAGTGLFVAALIAGRVMP